MKELLFSQEPHTAQENLLGLAEVTAIATPVFGLGMLAAKVMGLPLTPKRNATIGEVRLLVLVMFAMVWDCAYMGAMIGAGEKNDPGTHQSELLYCLIGSAVGVAFNLAVRVDYQEKQLKEELQNKQGKTERPELEMQNKPSHRIEPALSV
jgi:hypothetical protein